MEYRCIFRIFVCIIDASLNVFNLDESSLNVLDNLQQVRRDLLVSER